MNDMTEFYDELSAQYRRRGASYPEGRNSDPRYGEFLIHHTRVSVFASAPAVSCSRRNRRSRLPAHR